MYAGADHELLRCRGCEMVFYKVESWHSEDWDARFNPATGEEEIYCPRAVSVFPAPAPKSEKPDWAWDLWSKDTVLSQVIDETYAAKSQQLKILTAVGLRTAFDRATLLLGVDEALEFKQKIEQLTSDGRLGKIEAEQIEVLVNAGNAAAHRAWSPRWNRYQPFWMSWRNSCVGTSLRRPWSRSEQRSLPDQSVKLSHPRPPDTRRQNCTRFPTMMTRRIYA